MKKLITIIILILVAGGIYSFNKENKNTDGVACTVEAKPCSDGSYVGRTGPKCEFSACPVVPVEKTKSGIRGSVLDRKSVV